MRGKPSLAPVDPLAPNFLSLSLSLFVSLKQKKAVTRGSLSASQVALIVKNPPANAGDVRDSGLIPGSGRSPGGGHGNPLQYSCLENPMDRGAWWAAVHGVPKSRTRLKRLSTHRGTLKVPSAL